MFPNGNDLQKQERKVFGECDINDDSVDSLENVESGETWEPGSQPSEPSGRPTEAASAGSTPVSPSTRSRSTRTRQTAPTESSSQSPRTSPNSPRRISGQSREQGSVTKSKGQSWLLKRLVGNIFCQYVNADGNSDPSQFWRQALVTAGFFVSRNIDSIQGEPDLDYDEYDPMFLDNITNPWIWRRSWILSNPEGNVVRDDFPIANSNYVGDASGPHMGSKVKRRILREQRLFFALTAVGWDGERREVSPLALAKVRFTPT